MSVKPHAPDFGDANAPTSVTGGLGVPKASLANVPVATFNDLATVELRFKQNSGQIAAIILEPIMMNVGLCMPQPGFLEGLRELATSNGALLIFDEVKTGAKLGWGGASEIFGVKPDMVCLAKSIGGGFPLAAFGASAVVMDLISQHKVFHGGTCNTNPVFDGRGSSDLSRGAHAGKLRASGETQQETHRGLPADYREIRSAGLRDKRRSQWGADALS